MTRRHAVTLIEVLITMFIMAIGMLALLVLFPLGAVSMGQALRDDRCASTAAMAENIAIAYDVRDDANVEAAFIANPGAPVYVDPYGSIQGLPALGGFIQRVKPAFAQTQPLADRLFSLPDDITFLQDGEPDTASTGGSVLRGRRYTYAYLLRQQQAPRQNLIQLFVVVYSNRPVGGALTPEPAFSATVLSANSVSLNGVASGARRGGWVLDAAGNFYRITNIVDGGNTTVLETQQNFTAAAGSNVPLVLLEFAAEVFDKGTGWQEEKREELP